MPLRIVQRLQICLGTSFALSRVEQLISFQTARYQVIANKRIAVSLLLIFCKNSFLAQMSVLPVERFGQTLRERSIRTVMIHHKP